MFVFLIELTRELLLDVSCTGRVVIVVFALLADDVAIVEHLFNASPLTEERTEVLLCVLASVVLVDATVDLLEVDLRDVVTVVYVLELFHLV